MNETKFKRRSGEKKVGIGDKTNKVKERKQEIGSKLKVERKK